MPSSGFKSQTSTVSSIKYHSLSMSSFEAAKSDNSFYGL
ncbi:hypothetical protein AALP_AAs39140U000100 [Arabis alpina]|uniref:Uncharacterized protein n=1 Tax=Arabis alpina TaxID=50452 RepID=A0A087FWW3_ARAAL|nr:hypothetical protein AALP_AAs39140U000100 [Arabis alpina]